MFWKKTVKSPYLCNRVTGFDEIWHGDAYWPLTADRPLNFRIFENWRSWRLFRNGLTDLSKIGLVMQNDLLKLKSWISEIQVGGLLLFWKPLNHHISATFYSILIEFGRVLSPAPYVTSFFKFSTTLHGRSPSSSESKNCFNILCNYTMTRYTIFIIKQQILTLKTAVYPKY